jgi:hypothetical protein
MARSYYTIPLAPEPQSFGITLAGKEYRLRVRWFETEAGGWHLDILSQDGASAILAGVPLVTGCDLLEQHAYLGLGGELWVDSSFPPTLDNLGDGADLVFVVEEA